MHHAQPALNLTSPLLAQPPFLAGVAAAERLPQPLLHRLREGSEPRGPFRLEDDHGGVVPRGARARALVEVRVPRLAQLHADGGVGRVVHAPPHAQVRPPRHLPARHDDDDREARAR